MGRIRMVDRGEGDATATELAKEGVRKPPVATLVLWLSKRLMLDRTVDRRYAPAVTRAGDGAAVAARDDAPVIGPGWSRLL